ncbi:MAG: OsmC family protein [Planctomycetota bacterium]
MNNTTTPPTVTVEIGGTPFRTEITTIPEHDGKAHRIVSDVPAAKGGADDGPSPHDLLLSSLGACTAVTVKMYANRKEWPLERIGVALRHDPPAERGGPERISVELQFVGDLTEEQRDRLQQIAGKCPVHKTITGDVVIETTRADEG